MTEAALTFLGSSKASLAFTSRRWLRFLQLARERLSKLLHDRRLSKSHWLDSPLLLFARKGLCWLLRNGRSLRHKVTLATLFCLLVGRLPALVQLLC